MNSWLAICSTVDFRAARDSLSRGLNIAQMQLMIGWFLGFSHYFLTRVFAHTHTDTLASGFGQLLFATGATVP